MSQAERVAALQDLISKLKVQLHEVSGYTPPTLEGAVNIFYEVFEITDPMIQLAHNELVEQAEHDTLWSLAKAEAVA